MLKFSSHQIAALHKHAEQAYPNECCGILVGTDETDKIITDIYKTKNIAQNTFNRYEIDPKAHFEVHKEVRESEKKILGYYHSHPEAPARPSSLDAERAFSCYSFVIISIKKVQKETPVFSLQSWMWDKKSAQFIGEPLDIS